jgi:hypothetical protein
VGVEDAVSPMGVLDHPETYRNIAPQQVDAVCDHWEAQLAEEGAIPVVPGQRDIAVVARLGVGAMESGKP